MGYDPNNMSALTYANGFTLWHYKTPDPASDLVASGYFNEASSMFRTGDFIMANTSVNTAIASGVLIVKSNDGTAVDVSNISSFGLANAD